MMPTPCYYSVHVKCMKTIHAHVGSYVAPTCTEDIMVLRANMVALSFTVDWLSKAPCVSSNKMATWKGSEKGEGRHKKTELSEKNTKPCSSRPGQSVSLELGSVQG